MSAQTVWRSVTSNKSQREGEVFILHGDNFVMKIYAGSVPDPRKFASWLVRNLNMCANSKVKGASNEHD